MMIRRKEEEKKKRSLTGQFCENDVFALCVCFLFLLLDGDVSAWDIQKTDAFRVKRRPIGMKYIQ